ncbi:phosphoprotein phosphatase Ecym_2455 [Eremothecium cymbalariae DBVPG|uniref:Calcineurin-like phosphoesterase domain-containing protein n=1 Tax=Eremothecium cymbalariae (strain CBS 270.75 / DBVPG 7215 / KCTC 17166 / NRRL Y-17582) TaxID=931890 RepID=G8JPC4_ERECY|nr:Hypothetical protein Ecym_2455 [Eremothecium cymbalariae DBVPG\
MVLLSKKIRRMFVYLGCVVICGVFYYQIAGLDPVSLWGSPKEIFNVKFDLEDTEVFSDLFDESLVVNFGKKRCLSGAGVVEMCWTKSKLFSATSFHKQAVVRTIIKKNILGLKQARWFGISEYLFYDSISFKTLAVYFSKGLLKGSLGVFDISKEQLAGSKRVDDLYVKIGEWDIAMAGNGEYVSGINVLFGEDCVDPRVNWNLEKGWKLADRYYPSYLSIKRIQVRKGTPGVDLRVNEEGNFKVVQLADLHFGVGKGECKDEFPTTENCEADPKTLNFVETVLEIENPDLIVFTGDQIEGEWEQDSETALLKALGPAIRRGIPYAVIWGNHDDSGSMDRQELSKYVYQLPYSLFKINPRDGLRNDFGFGNYVLQVDDRDGSPAITFYFLDSHKRSPNPKVYFGYDWIKEEQLNYLEEYYTKNLADKHTDLSMAFIHIPLPEYLNFQSVRNDEQQNEKIGSFKEGITAPRYNSGTADVLVKLKVSAVSVGHDHCNDYCLETDFLSHSDSLWLCYGGAVGERGYAGYGGTERRIRIFEFNAKKKVINTWKRLHGSPDRKFDFQIIHDGYTDTA